MYRHQTEIRVPESRVGVIVGKDGETKKEIEEKTGCEMIVRKDGAITLICEDTIGFLKAQNIIKAIANGFSPSTAFKLLNDFVTLEIIDISEYVPENAVKRIMGRIIGKDGKMKKTIEETLEVNLSIRDKSVAIIGDVENVGVAREAIMMLIDGSTHSTVMKFMERRKRDIKSKTLDWRETIDGL
ncbi:KH domain protein [Archaeoglobus sulfaticallidus PM70-1]|uniref:KH domain protein n=1 Tax=Archaeoglobus sulfaticallidus PM70-1 TaxID=387631 RepID=N0BJQ6_9EURY|nr:KH domain-containing protein [Archaeoglobus sulfaticallidus]AGK60375.1 KH domain protein [Archaeoglobus sulfaticallidus PM70-1]